MIVSIHDPETLRAVRLSDVAAYLRSRGWRMSRDIGERGSLWVVESGAGGAEITLPPNRIIADYSLRVSEILEDVASYESRSEIDILTDIAASTVDLLRFRAPEADSGTLPFDDAVAFVEGCRDTILSAACSAWDHRPYFGRRKPQAAINYLSSLQMGQTERGSFVVTALSPVPPELRSMQTSLFGDVADPEVPYERRVTMTLLSAMTTLSGAVGAASLSGDMAPFEEGVDAGISANLCEAVAGLTASSPGGSLDFSISWAPARSAILQTGSIGFDADSIPILYEAARKFRELKPIEDAEIEGYIIQLNRVEGAVAGEITVVADVDGSLKKVHIDLPNDQYSTAVRAHDSENNIKCTGELVKEGRVWRLNNPRYFGIVS